MIRPIARLGLLGVALLTVLGLNSSPAQATNYWKNSVVTGNWSAGSNWSGASAAGVDDDGAPIAGEAVNIVFVDGAVRTVTYDVAAPSIGLLSIDLRGTGTTAATLSMPNNNGLTATGIAVGGYSGTGATNGRGAINQSDGTTTTGPTRDLILAFGADSTGDYTLSGGALVVNFNEYVGLSGKGTFNHSGGSHTVNASDTGFFSVGHNAGSMGTYNLSGTGTLSTATDQYIGYSGGGSFKQTGGTNTIAAGKTLYLGYNGGTGTYRLTGGSLSAGAMYVGRSGTGNLALADGGTLSVGGGAQPLRIAFAAGYRGDVYIGLESPAGTLQASAVIFGAGEGYLNFIQTDDITFATPISGPGSVAVQSAGVTTLSGINTYAGRTIIQTLGTLAVSADANLGAAPAAFSRKIELYNGGTLRATESFTLAATRGLNVYYGVISVDAGKTLTYPDNFTLGNDQNLDATLNKLGAGKLAFAGTVRIGTFSGGAGTLKVSDGEVSTGSLQVAGDENPGTLVVESGGLLRSAGAGVGSNFDRGTATVSGADSAWLLSGDLRVNGGGTLTIADGGSVSVNGGGAPVTLVDAPAGSGTLNIGAGGQPGVLSASGIVGINGGAAINFNHTGSLAFSIPISGLVDVHKLGAGTTTLSGTHPYGGVTTVQAGTLLVAGSISTATTVHSGAVLGGSGTTGAVAVDLGGSLAPGMSVGTLTTGTLTLGSGTFSRFELAAPGVVGGGVNDLVAVNGDLILGGTLAITELPGFVAGSYPLFSYTSIAVNQGLTFESSFLVAHPGSTITNDVTNKRIIANITPGAFLPGDFDENNVVNGADLARWGTNFGATSGAPHTQGDADGDLDVDGGDFLTWQRQFGSPPSAISVIAPVPEPTTLLLFIVSSAGLRRNAGRRRQELINE